MPEKKILVNATSLVEGGGVQVGLAFVQNAVSNKRFEWKFLVSQEIYNQLRSALQTDPRVVVVTPRPGQPIRGIRSRRKMLRLCNEWKPDLVYSIGFPSYVCFNVPEIGRYTNPWDFSDYLPWHLLGAVARLKVFASSFLRRRWAKRALYLETQTEDAKQCITKRLSFDPNRVFVVSNTTNEIYVRMSQEHLGNVTNESPKVFCLAAPYSHKNLECIPEVAYILKEQFGISPQFLLTIPKAHPIEVAILRNARKFGNTEQMVNLGRLTIAECVEVYKQSNAVFLPTLLEVFSATYLEAMAMGVPIVTTDFGFSRTVCGEAAGFFKPYDFADAATKIFRTLTDFDYRRELVNLGFQRFRDFPTPENKYSLLYDRFEDVISSTQRRATPGSSPK